MKLKIEFSLDNAAFAEYPASESATILEYCAMRLENNGFSWLKEPYQIKDINGNTIGEIKLCKDS